MTQVFFKRFLFCLFFTAQLVCSYATVKLPRLISDGMVLQRGEVIRVWGWADPGETIRLKFKNKDYKTVCKASSVWTIELPAMAPGGPFRMDIQGDNLITISNILIGDVWVCSGQSNMELPMSRLKDKYAAVIKNATDPNIRQFNIKTAYNFHGIQSDLGSGTWVSADPVSVLDFTGVGYFFARDLYQKYHVPIGLIKASVGGSPAEAWLSESALKSFPKQLALYQKYQDDAVIDQIKKKDEETANTWNNRLKNNDRGLEGGEISDWKNTVVPGFRAEHLSGVLWYRKEVDLPEAMDGKAGRLLLGTIVDRDETYINGQLVGSTGYQYPPRKYDVPAGILKKGKNTIVVRVIAENGKVGFTTDKPYELVVGQERIDLKGAWQCKVGYASDPMPGGQTTFQYQPGGLFNAMISPLLRYAVKGVIWYQGESNTGNPGAYEVLFKDLIQDWRVQWQKKDLPFLYVQLASFMPSKPQPSESNWAEVREAQLKTLELPNTGMAVATDIGEWNDIHPLNKEDVGKRLSLAAQRIAYHDTRLVYSGPLYQSMKRSGQKIVLSFTSAGRGLVAKGGGELKGFSVAGKDGKFVWAKARITGKQVEVWDDTIHEPAAVRYAWADNPEGANLYNKEGLPASAFRTDGTSEIHR